jgi:tetratricopeptide (TPR) repeat protein
MLNENPYHFIKLFFILPVFITAGSLQSPGQAYYTPQSLNTDSLSRRLSVEKGESRVLTMILLARQFSLTNPDTGIYFAREAYGTALKMNDSSLVHKSIFELGLAYHHKGAYPQAVRYGLESQRIAYANKDTAMLIIAVNYVVLSYLYSGNNDLAVQNAMKIFHFLHGWKHPFKRFDLHIRVGWVNMMAERYREAIPYFMVCESIAETAGNIPASFMMLNANHLGNCYMHLAKYDSALLFFRKVQRIQMKYSAPVRHDIPLNIGRCYYKKGTIDSAEFYFNHSMELNSKEGNISLIGFTNMELGILSESRQNWKMALQAYTEAIKAGDWILENQQLNMNPDPHQGGWYVPEQSVPGYIEMIGLGITSKAHMNSYLICKRIKDPEEALYHFEKYTEQKKQEDSILKKKEVMELATRYETERKEEQISQLAEEKKLTGLKLVNTRIFLFVLAAMVVLLIFAGALLIRQTRLRILHETSLLKQKLFRAQMNPHFIFNSLSSIQGFIMEQDHLKAATYLSRFAKLVRNILDGSLEELIPLAKEIETIDNYLQLQKVRYAERFDFAVETDKHLEGREIMIPPMLLQPFVENAIEHGIKHKTDKGVILVTFRFTDGELTVLIEDDGIGRTKASEMEKENQKYHASLSTSLITERIKMLNRQRRKKITFQITDLTDNLGRACGTRVTFVFPLG